MYSSKPPADTTAAATDGAPAAAPRPRAKRARADGATAAAAPRPQATRGPTTPQAIRYADLGGIESVLADVRELVEFPLRHPEVYAWLGVAPPRGVLLYGPPGCGKTALAHAIATECGVPFFAIAAPEVVSGMSGAHPRPLP